MVKIHYPAVAGSFYPDDPARLRAMVRELLAGAAPSAGSPQAIIAPHAGYIYSGPVAASGYALLAGSGLPVRRVVLAGPSHFFPLTGVALSSADLFATPLGFVPVDREAVQALQALPGAQVEDAAYVSEHSLEVHLPFLQEVLGEFSIVPLLVGDAAPQQVASVLDAAWGDGETLVIVSSDLSHYHDIETARRLDAATAAAIEALRPEGIREGSACGAVPVRGLLVLAKQRGLRARTVDLRTSGDTAGPRDSVVGYGTFVFETQPGLRHEMA